MGGKISPNETNDPERRMRHEIYACHDEYGRNVHVLHVHGLLREFQPNAFCRIIPTFGLIRKSAGGLSASRFFVGPERRISDAFVSQLYLDQFLE